MKNNDVQKIIVHVESDLEPIIPRFFEIRYDDIRKINEAIDREDFETIVRIGHSMKGAGGGYGFDYITEVGKKIEDAAKNCAKDEIRQGVDELTTYIENVEVVYD